ncbi:MAG: 50S ribosomal protein L10 [Candidatus Nomurabacteria bacterium]|jgi:large subunit ribosomal protein L10|nr:50S ribosomal protein L10 [Candidatus Nomurabacteria bacterium]
MAITRDKKEQLVAELKALLASAKMVVFAKYSGVNVADIQELRRAARAAGVNIKVVKNRLVGKAMEDIETFKATDKASLTGQLLYAISAEDEVAPAQVLDKFAKNHPSLELVGAFSGEGANLATDEVKALAGLPSKDQLIAEVVATLLSPVNDITSGLNGLPSILNAIESNATN